MILGDCEIQNYVEKFSEYAMDKPMISPFNEEKLQSIGYDITVGSMIKAVIPYGKVIDPDDVNSVYGALKDRQIIQGDYILKPKETISFLSAETIHLPKFLAGFIRPTDRAAKLAITFPFLFLEPTYSGRVEVILTNHSPNNIMIREGQTLAQILFVQIKGDLSDEKLRNHNSGYTAYGASLKGNDYENLSDEDKEVLDKILKDIGINSL